MVRKRDKKKPRLQSGVQAFLLAVLVVVATALAYANSFKGVFLLDDYRSIVNNSRVHQLWPLGRLLSSRRPVVDLTLAVNYAVNGTDVKGYHAVNLAIHIAAALALYGLVRRTLSRKPFRDRFGRAIPHLSFAIAMIWAIHPLQTESVTYIIQRSESLMGLCYFLTLYCLSRQIDSRHRIRWSLGAVACCALGMGSKAVMLTAPIVTLLYDRALLSGSWRETLRRRWGLYLGLFATWGILGMTNVAQNALFPLPGRKAAVGFGVQAFTWLEYAATQPGVILHYLRLSMLPHSLCLDYTWPIARTVGEVVPQVIAVSLLLAAVVWTFCRKPALGFLGASFFIILAPTSSIVPIRDLCFEHRMYLPLAGVVALIVVAGYVAGCAAFDRLGFGGARRSVLAVSATAAIVIALGAGTIRRNESYRSQVAMWEDVVKTRPENARALNRLGTGLLAEGRTDRATEVFRRAVQANPDHAQSQSNLCARLDRMGESDEAIPYCQEAVRLKPEFGEAHYNLGLALYRAGRRSEALEAVREAARLLPKHAGVQFTFGEILEHSGRKSAAIAAYARTLQIDPNHQLARQRSDGLKGS